LNHNVSLKSIESYDSIKVNFVIAISISYCSISIAIAIVYSILFYTKKKLKKNVLLI